MILAIDLGATNIRSALVNGATLKDKRKVAHGRKKKEILASLISVIGAYENYGSICVATAGFELNGKIQGALNMDFNSVPLRKILRAKYRVPVFIQNDARCAALAELNYGAGKKFRNFVLLTLGSGIGGAVVIGGKLHLGNGAAGEVGSMLIDGKMFEHLASGDASVALARLRGFDVDSFKLEELANRGNKKALKVYSDIGKNLGIGMANLSYVLAPEAFVIGGGFSRVKHIYPSMKKTLSEVYRIKPTPEIVKARFGDDAGMIGAALATQ